MTYSEALLKVHCTNLEKLEENIATVFISFDPVHRIIPAFVREDKPGKHRCTIRKTKEVNLPGQSGRE
jgi:hypothetical protein